MLRQDRRVGERQDVRAETSTHAAAIWASSSGARGSRQKPPPGQGASLRLCRKRDFESPRKQETRDFRRSDMRSTTRAWTITTCRICGPPSRQPQEPIRRPTSESTRQGVPTVAHRATAGLRRNGPTRHAYGPVGRQFKEFQPRHESAARDRERRRREAARQHVERSTQKTCQCEVCHGRARNHRASTRTTSRPTSEDDCKARRSRRCMSCHHDRTTRTRGSIQHREGSRRFSDPDTGAGDEAERGWLAILSSASFRSEKLDGTTSIALPMRHSFAKHRRVVGPPPSPRPSSGPRNAFVPACRRCASAPFHGGYEPGGGVCRPAPM